MQTLEDAWQVRRVQTQTIIKTINDPKATQAQHAKALSEFDARLTASEKGELTPIETMQLLGLFYVPRELQNTPPDIGPVLKIIAMQATLGWYDALRFADASGRAEIVSNEAFFTLALGQNAPAFVQFMKDHPDQADAAVKAGIQIARDQINASSIAYDQHWPASFGMLRMQCALKNTKTCAGPKAQPESEWPALLDQAAKRSVAFTGPTRAGERKG